MEDKIYTTLPHIRYCFWCPHRHLIDHTTERQNRKTTNQINNKKHLLPSNSILHVSSSIIPPAQCFTTTCSGGITMMIKTFFSFALQLGFQRTTNRSLSRQWEQTNPSPNVETLTSGSQYPEIGIGIGIGIWCWSWRWSDRVGLGRMVFRTGLAG